MTGVCVFRMEAMLVICQRCLRVYLAAPLVLLHKVLLHLLHTSVSIRQRLDHLFLHCRLLLDQLNSLTTAMVSSAVLLNGWMDGRMDSNADILMIGINFSEDLKM